MIWNHVKSSCVREKVRVFMKEKVVKILVCLRSIYTNAIVVICIRDALLKVHKQKRAIIRVASNDNI